MTSPPPLPRTLAERSRNTATTPTITPLPAHRERRRREAEAKGQRAEETGGQPVTLGITRAAELVAALEKITKQHADTLSRAMAELREVGDIESAEAKVYAARTSADAARARKAEAAAVTRAENSVIDGQPR